MAVLIPPPIYAVTVNDVTFWTRMGKLIKEMLKSKNKKDGNKIINIMLEIKMEVELIFDYMLILLKISSFKYDI
jgi:hypothetical protein